MANETRSDKEVMIQQAMKEFCKRSDFVRPNLETGEGCNEMVAKINRVLEDMGLSDRWEVVPITTYKIQRIETS